MPNQRIFEAQGLTSNGVAIGGMSAIGVNGEYVDVVQSAADGAIGVEDVDRAGLDVKATLSSTDVTKANALLDALVGNSVFDGREAGLATWHRMTIGNILWNSMRMNMSLNADATVQYDGRVRFADGTKSLADVVTVAGVSMVVPTLTYPARLYRPNAASFDPDPVGGADVILPLHLRSVSLSLSAPIIADYGDADIGHTSVDRGPWQALTVTLTHRDAKVETPSHVNAKLLGAGRGALTVNLLGRGGAAAQTLTVNNLLFTGATEAHKGETFTDYTITGVAGWKNGATAYTLNAASKLFAIA